MTDSYLEYVKLHILSLEQDLDNALMGEGYEYLQGQLAAATHLLTAYGDLLYNGNLRKEYNG
jgi:hypothetical protein